MQNPIYMAHVLRVLDRAGILTPHLYHTLATEIDTLTITTSLPEYIMHIYAYMHIAYIFERLVARRGAQGGS